MPNTKKQKTKKSKKNNKKSKKKGNKQKIKYNNNNNNYKSNKLNNNNKPNKSKKNKRNNNKHNKKNNKNNNQYNNEYNIPKIDILRNSNNNNSNNILSPNINKPMLYQTPTPGISIVKKKSNSNLYQNNKGSTPLPTLNKSVKITKSNSIHKHNSIRNINSNNYNSNNNNNNTNNNNGNNNNNSINYNNISDSFYNFDSILNDIPDPPKTTKRFKKLKKKLKLIKADSAKKQTYDGRKRFLNEFFHRGKVDEVLISQHNPISMFESMMILSNFRGMNMNMIDENDLALTYIEGKTLNGLKRFLMECDDTIQRLLIYGADYDETHLQVLREEAEKEFKSFKLRMQELQSQDPSALIENYSLDEEKDEIKFENYVDINNNNNNNNNNSNNIIGGNIIEHKNNGNIPHESTTLRQSQTSLTADVKLPNIMPTIPYTPSNYSGMNDMCFEMAVVSDESTKTEDENFILGDPAISLKTSKLSVNVNMHNMDMSMNMSMDMDNIDNMDNKENNDNNKNKLGMKKKKKIKDIITPFYKDEDIKKYGKWGDKRGSDISHNSIWSEPDDDDDSKNDDDYDDDYEYALGMDFGLSNEDENS